MHLRSPDIIIMSVFRKHGLPSSEGSLGRGTEQFNEQWSSGAAFLGAGVLTIHLKIYASVWHRINLS